MFKEILIENIKLKKEIQRLTQELQEYKEKYETIEFNQIYENKEEDTFICEKPILTIKHTDEIKEVINEIKEEIVEYILEDEIEQDISKEEEENVNQIQSEVKNETFVNNHLYTYSKENNIKSKSNKYNCKCKYNFVCLKCRK